MALSRLRPAYGLNQRVLAASSTTGALGELVKRPSELSLDPTQLLGM